MEMKEDKRVSDEKEGCQGRERRKHYLCICGAFMYRHQLTAAAMMDSGLREGRVQTSLNKPPGHTFFE